MTNFSQFFAKLVAGCSILLWGSFIHFAQASESESELKIKHTLMDKGVLRGDFNQKRSLTALKKPLLSSGHYVIHPELGVFWQTQQPISSRMVITPNGIKDLDNPAETSKFMVSIGPLLQAMMTADTEAIKKYFSVDARIEQQQWTLKLTPSDTLLKKWLSEATVEGNQHVSHVLLKENTGDSIDIVFSNVSDQPNSLSAEEKSYFGS